MHYSRVLLGLRHLTSELELTGGPLSHLFDNFYHFCVKERLSITGDVKVVTTAWRRGTRDENLLPGNRNIRFTLPDGRLDVTINSKASVSMVRSVLYA